MEEKRSIKSRPKKSTSRMVDIYAKPKVEELAIAEAALMIPEAKPAEVTEKDIDEMIVYNNEVTSIDFMMPEQEREILEQNLNLYENLEETQKVLSVARKNKKLTEDIRTLQIVDKSGKFVNSMYDVLMSDDSLEMLKEHLKFRLDNGADLAKSYKEVATALKIISDSRDQMIKSLVPQKNGKNARIALKFTNDNGDDFELGVEV